MGYFINPLFNVLLGIVFLRERLRNGQWLAVGIAAFGVGYMIVQYGSVPWIALILPVSFGLYGFIRKLLPVDPLSGLLMETVLLMPFALAYLFWLEGHGGTVTFSDNWSLKALLVISGPMTIVPLCLFAAGTKRIPLSTVGILQYLAPSLSFLLAIFVFGEAFDLVQLVSFGCIWLSLAIFTVEGLYVSRTASIPAPTEA
jgi:chloramphenicol-sensitive protein RarD